MKFAALLITAIASAIIASVHSQPKLVLAEMLCEWRKVKTCGQQLKHLKEIQQAVNDVTIEIRRHYCVVKFHRKKHGYETTVLEALSTQAEQTEQDDYKKCLKEKSKSKTEVPLMEHLLCDTPASKTCAPKIKKITAITKIAHNVTKGLKRGYCNHTFQHKEEAYTKKMISIIEKQTEKSELDAYKVCRREIDEIKLNSISVRDLLCETETAKTCKKHIKNAIKVMHDVHSVSNVVKKFICDDQIMQENDQVIDKATDIMEKEPKVTHDYHVCMLEAMKTEDAEFLTVDLVCEPKNVKNCIEKLKSIPAIQTLVGTVSKKLKDVLCDEKILKEYDNYHHKVEAVIEKEIEVSDMKAFQECEKHLFQQKPAS